MRDEELRFGFTGVCELRNLLLQFAVQEFCNENHMTPRMAGKESKWLWWRYNDPVSFNKASTFTSLLRNTCADLKKPSIEQC